MPGYFRAVALDLDGTLAVGDVVPSDVLRALDELRSAGVAALLVTGRIQEDWRRPSLAWRPASTPW